MFICSIISAFDNSMWYTCNNLLCLSKTLLVRGHYTQITNEITLVLHFTTQAFNRFYLKYIKPDILYLDICGSFFFYFDINVLRKSQLEKWNFWNNLSAHFPETRDLESVNALMPDTKSVVKSDEHRYRLRYI